MSATVAPDAILKELAALWTQEGKQGDAGDAARMLHDAAGG